MKPNAIRVLALIFTMCLFTLLNGCGGGGSGTSASTTASASQATGSITVDLGSASAKTTSKSVAALPAGVTTVRVTVTAPDITTLIQKDFKVSEIINNTVTITGVPVGSDRTVTVKGLDGSGRETHQGICTKITVAAGATALTGTITMNAAGPANPSGPSSMNTEQTISDQAQSMTIAFDGLAFVTGSFCAQTFYPPGKVADFFGFQYLRDNDPSAMGHNTDFTTLTANPVLAMLSDVQLKILSDLGTAEAALNDNYGYTRFPLAKAFRRLNDGDLPAGRTGLSRDAVKAFSAYLFSIDGEMSYLRAIAYAKVLGLMDATQQAKLAAMKGKGSLEWTQPTSAQVDAVLKNYPGQMMRTYAGEMLAWYLGSIDADIYFCPERQGTYFGSFFMKDIKAMNNPSYTIDSNMTANMGDAFLAALSTTQKAKVTDLVTSQKADLLSIVSKRNEISTLLRKLLSSGGTVDKATVISLSKQYGELDGDISYLYATAFSSVGTSLSSSQKSTLTALRKTATAETGGTPDYDSTCGNGYLYSNKLNVAPTVMNTDFMFGVCSAAASSCSSNWDCCSYSCNSGVCGSPSSSPFTLTSTVFTPGGTLPSQYTCDGTLGMLSHSPPLSWTGAPSGTVTFALTISTIALDGTKYNWVLYNIPGTTTSLAEATTVGTTGVSTDGSELRYYPPCSAGPGAKTYTFTLYALSGTPTFSAPVTGTVLTSTISPLIIGTSQVNVTYTRTGL